MDVPKRSKQLIIWNGGSRKKNKITVYIQIHNRSQELKGK